MRLQSMSGASTAHSGALPGGGKLLRLLTLAACLASVALAQKNATQEDADFGTVVEKKVSADPDEDNQIHIEDYTPQLPFTEAQAERK